MTKLQMTAKQMVDDARSQIEEIEVVDLQKLIEDDAVVVVDIRDVRERQNSGFIPNSFHVPRGMLEFWVDPESPYYNAKFGADKKYVLHCASGWRSALSALTLKQMGFEVAHLRAGISGWIDEGGAVEFPDTPSEKA